MVSGSKISYAKKKKKKKKRRSPIVIFSWCKTTQSIDVIREEVKYSLLNLLLYLLFNNTTTTSHFTLFTVTQTVTGKKIFRLHG